jgi:hypothetical protein
MLTSGEFWNSCGWGCWILLTFLCLQLLHSSPLQRWPHMSWIHSPNMNITPLLLPHQQATKFAKAKGSHTMRQTLRPPKTFPYNKYLTTVTHQHTQRLLPTFDLVKFQRFNTKHAHPPSQQRRGLPWAAKAGLCCTSTTQSRDKRISVSCRGECLQTTWKKYSPAVVVIRTPGRLGVGCRGSSLRQAGSKDHRHGHKPLSSKPKNKIPKTKTVSRSSRSREQKERKPETESNPIRSQSTEPDKRPNKPKQNCCARKPRKPSATQRRKTTKTNRKQP